MPLYISTVQSIKPLEWRGFPFAGRRVKDYPECVYLLHVLFYCSLSTHTHTGSILILDAAFRLFSLLTNTLSDHAHLSSENAFLPLNDFIYTIIYNYRYLILFFSLQNLILQYKQKTYCYLLFIVYNCIKIFHAATLIYVIKGVITKREKAIK